MTNKADASARAWAIAVAFAAAVGAPAFAAASPANSGVSLTSVATSPDNSDVSLTSVATSPANSDVSLTSVATLPDNSGASHTSMAASLDTTAALAANTAAPRPDAAGATAGAVCERSSAAAAGMARLREALERGRFVAYVPTGLRIVNGKPTRADAAAIRDDLKVLRARFDSLVTYGAANGNEEIPSIAAALGFRAMIIGVYDPFEATELSAALAAAKTNTGLVVGLSLGNEMLFFHRHSAAELEKLFDTVRAQAPHLPLATTEPFHMFYPPEAGPVLQRMDFLLANVHPIFEPWFRTASDGDAAQFVVNVASKLEQNYCGPILVKETGIPTAPETKGYTAKRQSSFYQELQHRFPPTTNHAFAYFAAFDAPWRLDDVGPAPNQHPAPEEAHWGLYDEHRHPKEVVAQIPPLPPPRP